MCLSLTNITSGVSYSPIDMHKKLLKQFTNSIQGALSCYYTVVLRT